MCHKYKSARRAENLDQPVDLINQVHMHLTTSLTNDIADRQKGTHTVKNSLKLVHIYLIDTYDWSHILNQPRSRNRH
jgi:hypothetical protein